MNKLFLISCLIIGLIVSAYSQTHLNHLMSIDSPVQVPSHQQYYMLSQRTDGNGDINNDGYNDIVIFGHPITGDTLSFAIFIYLGGAQLDTQADYILQSPFPSSGEQTYGLRIDYSNDINGDSIDDLIVSEYNAGFTNHGIVYIYFGSQNFDVIPDMILYGYDYDYGDPWVQYFGVYLNTSGDYNGDGFKDLAIGSVADYDGQVNIFYGGHLFDNVSDWSFHGSLMECFGASLAVGDINNDGFDDLCSLSTYDGLVEDVRIFFGSADFDNTPDWTYVYNTGFQQLFAMNQDINDDGLVDLLVFTYNYAFKSIWGSQTPSPELTTILPFNYNITKKYYAYFNNEWYLSLDDYQHGVVKFYHYNENTGSSIDYIITEHYNTLGWFSASYFLGDINGDNRNEILLGSIAQGPAQFKIFSDPNVDNVDEYESYSGINNLSCYPNPFNPSTTITYTLPKDMQVSLDIYNLKGQKVKTLQNAKQKAGQHSVIWNGTDDKGRTVASGMYFYRLKTPDKVLTSKMVMMKKPKSS